MFAAAKRGGVVTHPRQWTARVLDTLPHDSQAFTQGLEMSSGRLYESTGMPGRSTAHYGPPGRPYAVSVALGPKLFGEGLTVLGGEVWQLTWRDGVVIVRDAETLAERRRVSYDGEGWGLCHQAQERRFVMSDGTARLVFRDSVTFVALGSVTVTDVGRPVALLNELECTGRTVLANVLGSDTIVGVDTRTGKVIDRIDASAVLPVRPIENVLNGIAAIPGTDEYWITGKNWPYLYRVTFASASSRSADRTFGLSER
ncbi:glutaminyl-peptide cyclotransferase [Streptomyces sp. NPDC003038]|uniref:glutaminyl-peptide cyclotransferase n=1 Tax=unclassified Streptomyces TaxID=2593676 RepID=UPI0033B06ADC